MSIINKLALGAIAAAGVYALKSHRDAEPANAKTAKPIAKPAARPKGTSKSTSTSKPKAKRRTRAKRAA